MKYFYWTLAFVFNAYFVALQIASPGTFLGTIFSFSFVWFLLSVAFIFLGFASSKGLLKRLKRNQKIVFATVLAFFCTVALGNFIAIANPRLASGSEKVKYVIVLGGGITKDAELTDSIKERISVAADYIKNQPDAIAVVTGGKGPFSPCPESDILKPALVAQGIPEDFVLAENKAKDTIQNFLYSAQILAQHEGVSVSQILNSPVAVVTNDFHLARAERLAKRMGFLDVYGVAAKTPALFRLNTYCREICCYVKLNLRILFTGKPKKIA